MKMTSFLATLSLAAWAANAQAAPVPADTFDMDNVIDFGATANQNVVAVLGSTNTYYTFSPGSVGATLVLESFTVVTGDNSGDTSVPVGFVGLGADLSVSQGFGASGAVVVTPGASGLSIFVGTAQPVYFNVKWDSAKSAGFTAVFSATPIPVPAALPLLGGALAALGALGAVRRRRDA